MYSDAKKIHLLEKLLNTTDDESLVEVERILANGREWKKTDWSEIAGIFGEEDVAIMFDALAANRQIHPDDWK